jgi:putative transposase
LDAVPKKHQPEAGQLLRAMPYAETQAACKELREQFTTRYRKVAPQAVERLADDWERLVSFYQFPREHWPHLRTTNVVESVRHEASPWNGAIPVAISGGH